MILDLRSQIFGPKGNRRMPRKSRKESGWIKLVSIAPGFAFSDCGFQLGFGHRSHDLPDEDADTKAAT
jgi:hypothetical protein